MILAVWVVLAACAVAQLKRYQVEVQGNVMEMLSVLNHAVADSESLFQAWTQLKDEMQSDTFTLESFPIYVEANKDFVVQRIEIGPAELLIQTPETRRLFRSDAMELFDGDCVCQTTEDDFDVRWLSKALRVLVNARGPVPVPGTSITVQAWERSTVKPLPLLQPYVLGNCRSISVSPTSWFSKKSCGNADQDGSFLIVRASDTSHGTIVAPTALDIASVAAQIIQRHFFRFHVPPESLRAGKVESFFKTLSLSTIVRVRSRSFLHDVRRDLVRKIRSGVMTSSRDVEYDDGFSNSFHGEPNPLLFTRIGEEIENHHLVSRIEGKHKKVILPSVLSMNVPLTSLQRDLYCMAGFGLKYAGYVWHEAPEIHLGRRFEHLTLTRLFHAETQRVLHSEMLLLIAGHSALQRLFGNLDDDVPSLLLHLQNIMSDENEAANEVHFCYTQTLKNLLPPNQMDKALTTTLNVSRSNLRPSLFRFRGDVSVQRMVQDLLFNDNWDLARKVVYSITGSYEVLPSSKIELRLAVYQPKMPPIQIFYDGATHGSLVVRPDEKDKRTDVYFESQWSIRYFISARMSSFSEKSLKSTIDLSDDTAVVILYGGDIPSISRNDAERAQKLIVYCYSLPCGHIAPVLASFAHVESVRLRGLNLRFLDLTTLSHLKHVDVSYNEFEHFKNLELPSSVESVVMHHNPNLKYIPETFPVWFQHTAAVTFGDLTLPKSDLIASLLKRPTSSHTSVSAFFALRMLATHSLVEDAWKGGYIQFEQSKDIFEYDDIIENALQGAPPTRIINAIQSGLFSAVATIKKHFDVFQWSVQNKEHFLSVALLDHAERTMKSCISIVPLVSPRTRYTLQNTCHRTAAMVVVSHPSVVFYLLGGARAHVSFPEKRLLEEKFTNIPPEKIKSYDLPSNTMWVCYGTDCGVVTKRHVFLDQSSLVQSSILCLFDATDNLVKHQWNKDFIGVTFAGQSNGRHYGLTASWVDGVFQEILQKHSGGLIMSGETPNGGKSMIPSFLFFGNASASPDQEAMKDALDVARLFGAMLAIVLNNNDMHSTGEHNGHVPFIYIPISLDDVFIARLTDEAANVTEEDVRQSVLFNVIQNEFNFGRLDHSSFYHTPFPPAFQFDDAEDYDFGQFPGSELLNGTVELPLSAEYVLPYAKQVCGEIMSKDNVFFDALSSAFHSIVKRKLVENGWVPHMLRDVMNKDVISAESLKKAFDFATVQHPLFPPLKAALLRYVDTTSEQERGDLMRFITGQRFWKSNGRKIPVDFAPEKEGFAPMSFTCASSLVLGDIPPSSLADALRSVTSDSTYS